MIQNKLKLDLLNIDKLSPALVVLSGGQDSVTCLGLAIDQHGGADNVYAIGFKYGQQHSIELQCASAICEKFGISYKIIDISFLGDLVTSELTKSQGDVSKSHDRLDNLPASFVPNRNALFLTIAHAYAQEIGAKSIYTGVCQTDYSGYPDCRDEFIGIFNNALNLGYQSPDMKIITPLMYLTKSETFALAKDVGFLETVISDSHTCYKGDRSTLHDWGFGCGECPACELRSKGYANFIAEYGQDCV